MVDTILQPLNTMTGSMAALKEQHLKKYQDRLEVLERQVPLLDCAWNDVLQFSPFHPVKVFQLQVELGLIAELPHYKFFKIPLSKLDPSLTAIFFKTAPGEENSYVERVSDVDFSSIQDVPKATIQYYKTLIGTGELPFNYQFVPHVLYKDSLEISNVETIFL